VAVEQLATVPDASAARTVLVRSVPTDHAYVRHLASLPDEDQLGTSVVRLADPQEPWWPPPALDPDWLEARTDEFDVFHVHFGFDARSVDDLEKLVDVLRSSDRLLVQTVHDLRNPHHTSP